MVLELDLVPVVPSDKVQPYRSGLMNRSLYRTRKESNDSFAHLKGYRFAPSCLPSTADCAPWHFFCFALIAQIDALKAAHHRL